MSNRGRLRTWLGYFVIGGLLITLAACGKKQESAPNAPGAEKKEDLSNADPRLDPDLQAAVEVARKDRVVVDAKAIEGEVSGLPNQEQGNLLGDVGATGAVGDLLESGTKAGDGGAGALISTGNLRGRSGATRARMFRSGGGVGRGMMGGGMMGGGIMGQPPVGINGQPPAGRVAQNPEPKDEESSTENYQLILENPYKAVKNDPLSTFSSSVDTASYSNVRARLNAGNLPTRDMVRIADFINYFKYDYAPPKNDDPVAFHLEIAKCPWNDKHHLLKIGLQAKMIEKDKMLPRNLVFLIDTSGSMGQPNRLPLVKQSLRLLVDQLTAKDSVSIVTYAGSAELALTPTPGNEKDAILRVVDTLDAGGSTNGGGGILMAYD